MRDMIRWRSEQASFASRVRIVPQQRPGELVKWMNAMDVLVLPSRTTARWKEQFGRVIIEAAACGTPVIGADSGAIAEVIGAGGLVVAERSPDQLRQAITTLQADGALCRQLGEAGRAQALRLYAWPRVAQQMADIYRSVAQ